MFWLKVSICAPTLMRCKRQELLKVERRDKILIDFKARLYRVTHLVDENLQLTWILNVPSTFLGSR